MANIITSTKPVLLLTPPIVLCVEPLVLSIPVNFSGMDQSHLEKVIRKMWTDAFYFRKNGTKVRLLNSGRIFATLLAFDRRGEFTHNLWATVVVGRDQELPQGILYIKPIVNFMRSDGIATVTSIEYVLEVFK
jgi:hypothetical protein